MNFKNISLATLIVLGIGMMGCSKKNDRPKSKDTNNTIVERNTTLSKNKKPPIDVGHINHLDERTLSILSEISNEHSNHKSTLTVAQLKTITPALDNVEEANEKWYQSYIEGIDTNISSPTTIEEVQNMIDEVNGFNLPTNAILDRNFYKKTNGAFEHRFVYLAVTNPNTGRTWLNNNLGAGYADTNSSDYNASQQATASDDYLAYGSLFQWGRKADGHELINWIDSENGYGRYGTTTTRSNSPSNSLFITETNYSLNWRINKDDTLWASESSPSNVCPAGYRLPLNPHGSNDAANEWYQETQTWATKNAIGALGSVLKLSQTGYRDKSTGTVIYKNIFADYWSGSVNGASVRDLSFSSAGANTLKSNNSRSRVYGMSVRCIKDQPSLANQIPSERTNNILLKIASEHINTKSTITVEQLQAITPTLDNIDEANEKWYQSYIEATDTHFSSPATREEIQSMIDEVNSFNIPTNAILDRNFYKKTNGKFEHRFVYLPVTNPKTGRTWLNNNLGAEHANVDSSHYNPSQQATSLNDYLAYGSLFQWGRKADGHELINWTGKKDGTGKYGTTTSKANEPSNSLYIIEANAQHDWRVNRDDTLWASESSANNVCPVGYRLPLDPNGANDGENEWYQETNSWSTKNMVGAYRSVLKLVRVGIHDGTNGTVSGNSDLGGYWTGSAYGVNAHSIYFNSNKVRTNNGGFNYRVDGNYVRCIKDQTPTERSNSILSEIGKEHRSHNSIVTVAQLKAITPMLANVIDNYESSYRNYIANANTNFSSPATRDEVQRMVAIVNTSEATLARIAQDHSNASSTITVNNLRTIVPALKNIHNNYENSYKNYIASADSNLNTPVTRDDVQSIIDRVNTSEATLSLIATQHNNGNSNITITQLRTIIPALTNLDQDFEKSYQTYIARASSNISYHTTRDEVQRIIDAAKPANAVLDRNFYKKTNGKFEHRFVYLPVTNPTTGKTWLNNNLGAEYANITSDVYNVAQQATASNDHLAYGSLFEWGRKADGHELMNWNNGNSGYGRYGTTATKANNPNHSLYITSNFYPQFWRSNQDDTLWASESSANNVCPAGYRLPLNPHGSNDVANEWYQETQTWNTQNAAGALGSVLKLPQVGYRHNGDGRVRTRDTYSQYWTGSTSGIEARDMYFDTNNYILNSNDLGSRTYGEAVRCVKN